MNLALAALTLLILLIHGYHPLAEDGGLYVAGIEYLLRPALFPHYTAFVTAHLHYSIFATAIAGLVRIAHLPLTLVLLPVYCFSLWLTLYAGLQLLCRCFPKPATQFIGLSLFTAWATLPVAGTSLMMMDPYLTARSFSTPFSLLAIAFALDEWSLHKPYLNFAAGEKYLAFFSALTTSVTLCAASLLMATLFHPLMATYAAAMVLTIRLLRLTRPLLSISLMGVVAVATAAVLHGFASSESTATVAAAISRYYWFLSRWQWYELCGLLGPFCIFALILRVRQVRSTVSILCRSCIVLGNVAILIALLFAHESGHAHLVARLQPLRVFLLVYVLMALLLGATLAQVLQPLKPSVRILIPAAVLLANAAIFFSIQRASFPASQHIELPWAVPSNAWSRAFLWIRDNTPTDALFALDADYITMPGEDAQTFRATALRSSLPDYSKDGGEASITPSLGTLWQTGVAIQSNLSTQTDAERDRKLQRNGVTWMVLRSSSGTAHRCPYNNGVVKVCALVP